MFDKIAKGKIIINTAKKMTEKRQHKLPNRYPNGKHPVGADLCVCPIEHNSTDIHKGTNEQICTDVPNPRIGIDYRRCGVGYEEGTHIGVPQQIGERQRADDYR